MTTRNNMRRELQDLAKLADSMPKERPTPPPAQAANAGEQAGSARRTPWNGPMIW